MNYNTSREPLLMNEFIALAESNGWSLAAPDSVRPSHEVILVDAKRREIVAYSDETTLSHHIGFKGGAYGLVELWREGNLEKAMLEGHDLDPEVTCLEELSALVEILKYYEPRPLPGRKIRRLLKDIGSRI
jgi:hypothetical protein